MVIVGNDGKTLPSDKKRPWVVLSSAAIVVVGAISTDAGSSTRISTFPPSSVNKSSSFNTYNKKEKRSLKSTI